MRKSISQIVGELDQLQMQGVALTYRQKQQIAQNENVIKGKMSVQDAYMENVSRRTQPVFETVPEQNNALVKLKSGGSLPKMQDAGALMVQTDPVDEPTPEIVVDPVKPSTEDYRNSIQSNYKNILANDYKTPYIKGVTEDGMNCINGVCSLIKKAGAKKFTRNTYTGNATFNDNLENEGYYTIDPTKEAFEIGDIVQYSRKKSRAQRFGGTTNFVTGEELFPQHAKIIADKYVDKDGVTQYVIVHNYGEEKLSKKEISEAELLSHTKGYGSGVKYMDGLLVQRYGPDVVAKSIEEREAKEKILQGQNEFAKEYNVPVTNISFSKPMQTVEGETYNKRVNKDLGQIYTQNYDKLARMSDVPKSTFDQMLALQAGIQHMESGKGGIRAVAKKAVPDLLLDEARKITSDSDAGTWVDVYWKDNAENVKDNFKTKQEFKNYLNRNNKLSPFAAEWAYYNSPRSKGAFQQKELSDRGRFLNIDPNLESYEDQAIASLALMIDNYHRVKKQYPEATEEELLDLSTLMHNAPSKALTPEFYRYFVKNKDVDYVKDVKRFVPTITIDQAESRELPQEEIDAMKGFIDGLSDAGPQMRYGGSLPDLPKYQNGGLPKYQMAGIVPDNFLQKRIDEGIRDLKNEESLKTLYAQNPSMQTYEPKDPGSIDYGPTHVNSGNNPNMQWTTGVATAPWAKQYKQDAFNTEVVLGALGAGAEGAIIKGAKAYSAGKQFIRNKNLSKTLSTNLDEAALNPDLIEGVSPKVKQSFPPASPSSDNLILDSKKIKTAQDDIAFTQKAKELQSKVPLTRAVDKNNLVVKDGKLFNSVEPYTTMTNSGMTNSTASRNTSHWSYGHVGDPGHGSWKSKSTAIVSDYETLSKKGYALDLDPTDTFFYNSKNMEIPEGSLILTRDKKLYDDIIKNTNQKNVKYHPNTTNDEFESIVNSYGKREGDERGKDLFEEYLEKNWKEGKDVAHYKPASNYKPVLKNVYNEKTGMYHQVEDPVLKTIGDPFGGGSSKVHSNTPLYTIEKSGNYYLSKDGFNLYPDGSEFKDLLRYPKEIQLAELEKYKSLKRRKPGSKSIGELEDAMAKNSGFDSYSDFKKSIGELKYQNGGFHKYQNGGLPKYQNGTPTAADSARVYKSYLDFKSAVESSPYEYRQMSGGEKSRVSGGERIDAIVNTALPVQEIDSRIKPKSITPFISDRKPFLAGHPDFKLNENIANTFKGKIGKYLPSGHRDAVMLHDYSNLAPSIKINDLSERDFPTPDQINNMSSRPSPTLTPPPTKTINNIEEISGKIVNKDTGESWTKEKWEALKGKGSFGKARQKARMQYGGSLPKYQDGTPEEVYYGKTYPEVTVTDKLDRTNPTAVRNYNRVNNPIAYAATEATDKFASNYLMPVAEMAPGTGDVMDVANFGDAVYKGDYGTAAMYAGFGLLPGSATPLVKGTKKLGRGIKNAYQEAIFRGVEPLGYGIKRKAKDFIPNLIKNSRRSLDERALDLGYNVGHSSGKDVKYVDGKKIPRTVEEITDRVRSVGKSKYTIDARDNPFPDDQYVFRTLNDRRRIGTDLLDSFNMGLRRKQNWNTFESLGEDVYRINRNRPGTEVGMFRDLSNNLKKI